MLKGKILRTTSFETSVHEHMSLFFGKFFLPSVTLKDEWHNGKREITSPFGYYNLLTCIN